MATSGVTTGINSGLPISTMVSAMVDAEKTPKKTQLDNLEKSTTTKFSALGELASALNTFQSAMKDLNSSALFEKRTATSSNTTALAATAGTKAAAGTYSIEVKNLASASKVATAIVPTDFSSGSSTTNLRVQVGSAGEAIDVSIAADSDLASVRDQLNTALKDKGVTANIVKDPSTGNSRLVFSGSETGAGKDIIVSSDDAALSGLAVDGRNALAAGSTGAGAITKASNAVFTVDGLELQSASNKVTDAIADVTIDLTAKTEADKPLTLTVGQDTDGVKNSIKKFVDSYNALVTTSNKLTSVTKVGDDSAPVVGGLVGDATVRSLLGNIRNELVNPTGPAGARVLADLGITTQKDGTLKIDDTKLTTALKDNYEAVGQLFTGDTGLMSRVDSKIAGYTQTGGIIEQRQKALNTTLTGITKQREDLDRRMESLQTRLLAQFNAMDALVGQLNGTSSQLDQVLSSLPGVTKKD